LTRLRGKDPKIGNSMINARAETATEKLAYRDTFRKRRRSPLSDFSALWPTRFFRSTSCFAIRRPRGTAISKTVVHTLLGDHQNTVRDVVSASGSVENHLVYSTYGEVTSETPSGYSPFMKYTGKPFDVVTGLQYNLHR
jgi:hypothetical protein